MVKSGKNFLNKGIIKLLILDALYEKEAHGYEIIKKISSKFKGIYEPSPGIIYPTLELLLDQELIGEKIENGKRVYYLTEKGRMARDDGLNVLTSFLNKKIQPNERVKVIELLFNIKNVIYEKLYELDEDRLRTLNGYLDELLQKIKKL
ncbi:MAG: PadR family transcriptional regulator [Nitrososphaeria archaeon]